MGRVIFMCGPSGSGKTTYAKELENQGMVRLSFDVVMWERGISAVPLPQDVRTWRPPRPTDSSTSSPSTAR